MRMMTYLGCALAGILIMSHPRMVRADRDDWKENLKEDYEDRIADRSRAQAARGDYEEYPYEPYAVEPYWSYPQEYYIFGGHPSRYYYTYPDRYYTQRYWYNQLRRAYGYERDPDAWRHDVYGYRRPFWENDLRRGERRDRDIYRYYDEDERYRNEDRGGHERRHRR